MKAEPRVLKINLRGDTPQEIIDLLNDLQGKMIFYFGLWALGKCKSEV
jgi:hypothetical protein